MITTKRRGIITAQKVILKLVELGFDVSVPIGDNSSYDVILDWNNKLFKGQIKTARIIRENVISLPTSSVRFNTKKVYRTNYIGKVDFILGYCPQIDKYIFYPVIENSNSNAVSFRQTKPKNSQVKKINYASDYDIKNLINYLNLHS